MALLLDLMFFFAGVGFLVVGAWALVTGGARIAALLGIPPVVVGLTIVAFGTSAPELFVSLVAALRGNSDLMLGNVIGSNVANIGLILGSAVLLVPVSVEKNLMRLEIPLLMMTTGVFTVLGWDTRLTRLDGLLLVMVFLVFMTVTLRRGRLDNIIATDTPGEAPPVLARRGLLINSLLVLAGIAGLTLGGELIVDSAVKVAARLGASEAFIGLTLVAIGTSLPELATTLVAAMRRQSDIALGNIIGSNLFNMLAVAGPVVLVRPVTGQDTLRTHQLPGMILLTLLLPLACVRGPTIRRIWGPVLLMLYVGMMVWWQRSGV